MKNLIIIEQLESADFFNQTKAQLIRDFAKVGVDLNLTSALSDKENLSQELIQELDAMLEHRPDLFAQLLYIMDLSESKVREIIQTSDYTARDIAMPMIHRCAEKVYWRQQFSNNTRNIEGL